MFVRDILVQASQIDDWLESFFSTKNMELSWLESIIFTAPFSKSAWISVFTGRDFSIDIGICLRYLLWRGSSEKVTLLSEIIFSTAWSLDSSSKIFQKYFNLPASEYWHWRSSGNKNLTNGWTWGRFWRTSNVLIGGRDLTSGEVKTFEAKGKSSVFTSLATTAGQGAPAKGSIAWCNTFECTFQLGFCFRASANLLFKLVTNQCRHPSHSTSLWLFLVWQMGL